MNIEKYDEAVAKESMAKEKKERRGNRKWWVLTIILGIIILFAVTTPDKYAHKEAVSTEVSSAVTNSLAGKVGSWAVLGNIVVSKIVDMTLDSNIRVDNYLVFSLARAELNGERHVISIGALNHVWVLFGRKDLQGLIDTQVNTLWQKMPVSTEKTEDIIDNAIDEVSTKIEDALQKGVNKAVESIIESIIGGEQE